MTSALSLHEVSKRFPGVKALDGVSLDLVPGSVTALIGENGAGKSTIVKILTGIYRPDEGQVRIGGKPVRLNSPRDAWAAGVAAIHQETVMFDELSVAENVFMGHMPGGALIDPRDMRDRTASLLARIEADFEPETQVKRLSVAQKHMVEIARALSHDARVVIMDEPTAALSRHEIDELFKLVDSLRSEGRAILFISHKFDEIFGVSDRWVCLRDGRKVGEGATAATTEPELVRLMVGRPVEQIYPKRDITPGPVVLEVDGLSNPTEFADISFELRRGEILGFYGLVGSGRSEAMQCLFGLTPPTTGRVLLDGAEVAITEPAEAIAAGMAYVPEDRQEQGLALPLGVTGEYHHRFAERPREAHLSVPQVRNRGDRNAGNPAVDPDGRMGEPGQRAFRRQPAESRHLEVAGHAAEGRDPRRADQRHRRGLQGRRP